MTRTHDLPAVITVDRAAIYTSKGLADLLGISLQQIYNRRCQGASMPEGHIVAGRLLFSGADVAAWLEGGER